MIEWKVRFVLPVQFHNIRADHSHCRYRYYSFCSYSDACPLADQQT